MLTKIAFAFANDHIVKQEYDQIIQGVDLVIKKYAKRSNPGCSPKKYYTKK